VSTFPLQFYKLGYLGYIRLSQTKLFSNIAEWLHVGEFYVSSLNYSGGILTNERYLSYLLYMKFQRFNILIFCYENEEEYRDIALIYKR
jgi:hypothetical protein